MHSHERPSLVVCPTVHCIQYEIAFPLYIDEVLQHQVTLLLTDASRVCVTNMQCGIQANVLCDGYERLKLASE